MAHRIKFSLDTGKSHPEFAHDALAVYEGLRENAASPNPPIAVEDVKSTIDAYFSAITIASCYGAPYSRLQGFYCSRWMGRSGASVIR